ncbi:DeoR/GlpR family DNA-binding transcription regulator [Gordonia jinhuaensis]|uniref:Lactose phosphotransferase system repressor n=1 Tax=Gordonia jinhuaensis TaxID=1517702 RepID=A0A916T1F1_9ACTN|nr:DeoR/GlpR family DNA-binding transcription regulator [Gordonia jinhuaensis]GGB26001.1 D-beta-D-heptose 1-phosphate adenosyltransferase [Gordonia jinhuaensis]
MYAEERQRAIADLITEHGRAAVNELAERFAVTGETVRRDLDVLERSGHLRRVHGGAVPMRAIRIAESGVDVRAETNPADKRAIGAAAARFAPHDGGTLLIDAGTTTIEAARSLPRDRTLSVFTNSVAVAGVLAMTMTAGRGGHTLDLHILGGRVRGLTQAAVGVSAVSALARLRVDVAFVGTNALSVGQGLATPDPDEAAVKAAMIAAANRVVVLCDSSKLERDDVVSFGSLDDIDVLVTDDGITTEFSHELTDKGVEVVIA